MDHTAWLAWTDQSVHWKERYPQVAEAIKDLLRKADKPLSTTQVVKGLLADLTQEQADPLTKTVYSIVAALVKHDLKDWVTLGPKMTRGIGGKMAFPRVWQAPQEQAAATKVAAPTDNGKLWQHMARWEKPNIRALAQSPLERNNLFTKFMALVYEVEEGHAPDWAPENSDDLSDLL